MNNPKIDSDGTKRWYNEAGKFHRLDGPAIEYPSGSKSWYQNGKLHRLDGPAKRIFKPTIYDEFKQSMVSYE